MNFIREEYYMNSETLNIIYLFVSIVTIIMCIVSIVITTTKKEKIDNRKEKIYDVELIKLMLTDNIDNSVNNMLDNIIKNIIDLYLIFNNVSEENYINIIINNDSSSGRCKRIRCRYNYS